jgi:protein translocase SecG subunit
MSILAIAQIVVSVVLIILILMQERSSGTGGIFGGGSGEYYQSRRGLERGIFISTIVLAVVFSGLALLNLVI